MPVDIARLRLEVHEMASLIQRGVRKLRREWVHRTAALRSPLRVGIIGYGGIAP